MNKVKQKIYIYTYTTSIITVPKFNLTITEK